ncbi:MAG: peptidase T [Hyphomicrobiales bacterium]
MNAMLAELEDRLVRYVQIDTQSDASSKTTPSTERQFDLLRLLERELTEIGARDVVLTPYGALLATVPSNVPQDTPTIALCAHVDTTQQFNGFSVKPLVHRNWQGADIVLPDDPAQVLSGAKFPYLAGKIGEDIVTASGKTLLGADDKAGVAIVMTVAHHLLANPAIPHGDIRVCFTPDEEIGRGVHKDLPRDLGVDVAYTLDGAEKGEIVYETFSADQATVRVEGVSVHPGWAKGKLVNALHLLAKIIDTLPQATQTPETTEGRQGFWHVISASGGAAEAEMTIILRDFEREGLRARGEMLQAVCAAIAAGEPRARITCTISEQYRNMRYWLENDMKPVEIARAACKAAGIEPFSTVIRGGTDGSRLTEMGVPAPNIFTGMQEIHGPLEWISLQDMLAASQVCVKLAELWSREPANSLKSHRSGR